MNPLNDDLNGFKSICFLDDLKKGGGRRFIINELDVAVIRIENEVYALSNICPHQHTALIYDGFIEDGCVVCPVHGWMFDLKTGRTPSGTRGLEKYEVKIIKGEVFVKAAKKEIKW